MTTYALTKLGYYYYPFSNPLDLLSAFEKIVADEYTDKVFQIRILDSSNEVLDFLEVLDNSQESLAKVKEFLAKELTLAASLKVYYFTNIKTLEGVSTNGIAAVIASSQMQAARLITDAYIEVCLAKGYGISRAIYLERELQSTSDVQIMDVIAQPIFWKYGKDS
jgi:hypothetical protein